MREYLCPLIEDAKLLFLLISVMLIGTAVFVIIEGWPPIDAFYMTTILSVGDTLIVLGNLQQTDKLHKYIVG